MAYYDQIPVYTLVEEERMWAMAETFLDREEEGSCNQFIDVKERLVYGVWEVENTYVKGIVVIMILPRRIGWCIHACIVSSDNWACAFSCYTMCWWVNGKNNAYEDEINEGDEWLHCYEDQLGMNEHMEMGSKKTHDQLTKERKLLIQLNGWMN